MDWFALYEQDAAASVASNPRGPANGASRVLRGGSWLSGAGYCRAAYRYRDHPTFRGNVIGFRVVVGGVRQDSPGNP